jgi:hypothetical protein
MITRVTPPLMAGGIESRHLRHLDVGDQDVRLMRAHGIDRLLAIASLRHHGDIALHLE